MKRILAIFFALLMVFSLNACLSFDADGGQGGEQNDGDVGAGEENADPEDMLYKKIPRYSPVKQLEQKLSFSDAQTVLQLAGPDGWTLEKAADGSFDIVREGRTVGNIRVGSSLDFEEWKTVDSKTYEKDGIFAQRYVERKGSGESISFRYRFRYEFFEEEKLYRVTLTAECAEISESAAQSLLRARISSAREASIGQLYEAGKEPKSILILGNSFIATSKIGSILREMIWQSGKDCEVVAVSRGYATASQYAADADILAEIRSGQHDAVFLCGFYNVSNAASISTFLSACSISDTSLVIFPAHNESDIAFLAAKEENPSVLFMNWKEEINSLIAYRALSKWDFCVDDAHDHSTALAGYVGAHMIYRALYNEMPRSLISSIPQAEVDELLGDYAATGYVPKKESGVYYFD